MAAVLTTTSSLTRFLERHFGMRLDVRLHDQFVHAAIADEAVILGCPDNTPSLRRQVSLLHRNSVMYDAESVLPLDGLNTELIGELQDGKRPLANLLADHGLSLSRSDLSIARIQTDTVHNGRWARRSVLRSESGTRALVVEVFHDEIWRRLQNSSRRY